MKKKVKKKKKKRAPGALIKKDAEAFKKAISTEEGFLKVFTRLREQPVELYKYQYAMVTNPARFQLIAKARQIGGSYGLAAKALVRGLLRDGHDSVFVSYNLEDAKEKIIYVRELYDEIPLRYRKALKEDTQKTVSFESLNAKSRPSRIRSLPSKAPRGSHGDIYLDEFAHYREDRKIYKGSTAVIIRGDSQFILCSTPLGRRGMFWEISTQELKKYPAYTRQYIPWWLCPEFCIDPKMAAMAAPRLATQERVEAFGTKALKQQFESLDLEDFQQEYELRFVDESTAYFPYELILGNTTVDPDDLWESISDVQTPPTGKLKAGFDIGRKRHVSVFCIVEENKMKVNTVRHINIMQKMEFQMQENLVAQFMEALPITPLYVDQTGLGMQMAESLSKRFPNRVIRENFNVGNKVRWCGDFKIGLERKMIKLPKRRDVVSHIHAIRRKISQHGNVIFDVDSTDRSAGHADIFWSLALACQRQRNFMLDAEDRFEVRILG